MHRSLLKLQYCERFIIIHIELPRSVVEIKHRKQVFLRGFNDSQIFLILMEEINCTKRDID